MKKEEIIAEIGNEEINRVSIENAIDSLLSKKVYGPESRKGKRGTEVIFSGNIDIFSVEVIIHVKLSGSSVEVNIY